MFYGQCWKCGERWELGTASTCKCPEEPSIDWKEYSIPVNKMPALSIGNIKPSYNMMFHHDGKQVGALDFNGPEITFTGNADESAKIFFDMIAQAFKARLEQERADEREACAKFVEDVYVRQFKNPWREDLADAIRARSNT